MGLFILLFYRYLKSTTCENDSMGITTKLYQYDVARASPRLNPSLMPPVGVIGCLPVAALTRRACDSSHDVYL